MTSVRPQSPHPPGPNRSHDGVGRAAWIVFAVLGGLALVVVISLIAVAAIGVALLSSEPVETPPGQVVGPGDSRQLIGTYEEFYYPTRSVWPGADAFEESRGVPVPSSTTDIHLAADGFQDPIYHVRFTVEPDDLATITGDVSCGALLAPDESIPPVWIATQDVDWWVPQAATDFTACAETGIVGGTRLIFIDLSNEDAPVVYIRITLL